MHRVDRLDSCESVCCGDRSGPSPVDRRKPGTKLTLLTDRCGTPLVLRSSPANSNDHHQILPAVAAYPSIGGLPGRPRPSPVLVFADNGYGRQATREALLAKCTDSVIRHRNRRHGSHLGRFCWPIERTQGRASHAIPLWPTSHPHRCVVTTHSHSQLLQNPKSVLTKHYIFCL